MSLPGKLSEEVAEGGDNFSTGQRQVKQVSSLYLNYIIESVTLKNQILNCLYS